MLYFTLDTTSTVNFPAISRQPRNFLNVVTRSISSLDIVLFYAFKLNWERKESEYSFLSPLVALQWLFVFEVTHGTSVMCHVAQLSAQNPFLKGNTTWLSTDSGYDNCKSFNQSKLEEYKCGGHEAWENVREITKCRKMRSWLKKVS